jgi:hypothetical protein
MKSYACERAVGHHKSANGIFRVIFDVKKRSLDKARLHRFRLIRAADGRLWMRWLVIMLQAAHGRYPLVF